MLFMKNGIESFVQDYTDSPYSFKALLSRRLLINKEMGRVQSRVAILASAFISSGREGLQEADKKLGEPSRPAEEVLEIFKLKAPEDLSAVVVGCVVLALEQTMGDGYFSSANFHSKMEEAVRGTQIRFPVGKCEAPEGDCKNEVIERGKLGRMIAATKEEYSFFSFFADPNLMPDSLKKYLFETLGIPNEPFKTSFIKVLKAFKALAFYISPETEKK